MDRDKAGRWSPQQEEKMEVGGGSHLSHLEGREDRASRVVGEYSSPDGGRGASRVTRTLGIQRCAGPLVEHTV